MAEQLFCLVVDSLYVLVPNPFTASLSLPLSHLYCDLKPLRQSATVYAVQKGAAGSAARSMWREEGHGADPSAVSGALIALLLGYLDAALPHHQQHSGQAPAAEEDMQVCCSVYRLYTDSTVLCGESQGCLEWHVAVQLWCT